MGGMFSNCCCGNGVGYKVVHAKKIWYGRKGFSACDGFSELVTCDGGAHSNAYEPLRLHPEGVRYLRIRREIRYKLYRRVSTAIIGCTGTETESENSYEAHLILDTSVDRFTGAVQVNDCRNFSQLDGPCPENLGSDETTLKNRCLTAMQIDAVCDYASWNTDPETLLTTLGFGGAGVVPAVNAITEKTLNFQADYEYSAPSGPMDIWTGSVMIEVTLDEPYEKDIFYQDAKDLLDLWKFNDDVHYPWRHGALDTETNKGPLAHYQMADGWDESGTQFWYLYSPDEFAIVWAIASIAAEDSFPLNITPDNTGEIIGIPVDGKVWNDPYASVWQDAAFHFGARVFFPGVYFGATYDEHALYLTKWAESKVALPAHNYARPCGADADSVDCDDVQQYPTAAPCEERDCNTTETTGDFTTVEFRYNVREYKEADRLRAQNPTLNAYGCDYEIPDVVRYKQNAFHDVSRDLSRIICETRGVTTGAIIYCSPNIETFPGASYDLGWMEEEFFADNRYSFQWLLQVRQYMLDPLHLKAGCIAYDDATREEARCEVPGLCPPLPPGIFIGCLDTADLDTEDTEIGNICDESTMSNYTGYITTYLDVATLWP